MDKEPCFSIETGCAEWDVQPALILQAEPWTATLEWDGGGTPRGEIEACGDFLLFHFNLPEGAGAYSLSLLQPCLDICRSWAGVIDCWRGSELTSIALNYRFESAVNLQIPAICNFNREGMNRGVVSILDHVPETLVEQRLVLHVPPIRLLKTRFSRRKGTAPLRETLVLFKGRVPFAEAVQHTLRFCREQQAIVPMRAPDWAREPVWCSWYSHLYGLTQGQVEAQLPHLEELGIRTVLIDASWFFLMRPPGLLAYCGDYEVETSLFPDLKALCRRIHDAGLKVMLWCSPMHVGIHSKARAKLEPFCCLRNGERDFSRLSPYCPEAIQHAASTAERVMREFDLDGLKIDFMDGFDQGSEDPGHPRGDKDFGAAMADLMAAMRDAILSVKPDAAIEYRISYSTVASLPYANCHRGNDSPFDGDYIRRENLFLRLFCEHPSAVWSDYAAWHPDESERNVSLILGQQVFSGGVPTLSMDLATLSAIHRSIVGRWLEFYAEHRDALARARLTVHSADAAMSVSSLQDDTTETAFVLLAGQHVPRSISLPPHMDDVWMLNASAEPSGLVQVRLGESTHTVRADGYLPARLLAFRKQ